MASQVKDLMTTDLATVDQHTSLVEVARLMRDEDVGGVIVSDDGKLVGLLTDRDIVVRAVAENRNPTDTGAADVASRDLETLRPDADLDDAVTLMRERAVRRAPVVDGGKVVGIVTLGDLALAQDRRSALAEISEAPANH
jgi:CBS domain-containing protein